MKKHPFQIAIAPNPQMRCWDLMVQFGNFKTREAADEFAQELMKRLEQETHERVQ